MGTPPNSPTPDYEIQPSSDYGTLGPGADVKVDSSGAIGSGEDQAQRGLFGRVLDASVPAGAPPIRKPLPQAAQPARLAIVLVGMMLGFAFLIARQLSNTVQTTDSARFGNTGRSHSDPATQKRAEEVLSRVARNDPAAAADAESQAAGWRGRIQLTPQLTSLVTAGLNANDLRARAATIQVDLAAMNVIADDSSADRLAAQADSNDHATRIWAIWTLGLLANRGVQADHIVAVLEAHLSDNDVESRHWAAEALSYTGSDASIQPLLKAMRNDPSPMVRERAACGLAESGMLTKEQRRTAVPTLLLYVDDTALDPATRSWTYHALRDITGQQLPDDSAAWRRWYEGSQR